MISYASYVTKPALLAETLKNFPFRRYCLLADETVFSLYGERCLHALREERIACESFSFPSGEEYKNRKTKEEIEDQLLQYGMGRDSALLALGGGVVGDLTGFVAATYLRGIAYFNLPTTLLAMVDASIGGKTGVNTPQGKNLVGAFYMPQEILVDPAVLQTLPEQEWINGMAEVCKHALIADLEFCEYLENCDLQEEKTLRFVLEKAAALKQDVTKIDAKEKGMRAILNFGHTIGHALERALCYRCSHGYAVGIGIAFETYLSYLLGYMEREAWHRVLKLLEKWKISYVWPSEVSFERLSQGLDFDKKNQENQWHFVLLQSIGNVVHKERQWSFPVDRETIRDAFSSYIQEVSPCFALPL